MAQPSSNHPLQSKPVLKNLLDRLHAISLEQEGKLEARGKHYPTTEADKLEFVQQLVALDEDKCHAMYLILRAMGARRVIEAGTSYGVSLLWLLAAVTANHESLPAQELPPLVIGTENEPPKAAKARQHVKEGFGEIPSCLNLLEGDLLKTIPEANLEDRSIDALLLDIWAPLSLPVLQIVLPKLRVGGIVFIDNSVAGETRYADLLKFIRDPGNGFQSTTLPHSGGFEMAVFLG